MFHQNFINSHRMFIQCMEVNCIFGSHVSKYSERYVFKVTEGQHKEIGISSFLCLFVRYICHFRLIDLECCVFNTIDFNPEKRAKHQQILTVLCLCFAIIFNAYSSKIACISLQNVAWWKSVPFDSSMNLISVHLMSLLRRCQTSIK